jgi:O-antigen ligase
MQIGIMDGFVQITSQNIGAMFLVAPYLLSLQFRADAGKSNSMLTKLALVMSLIFVAVSGRRALWLVVALTPFTILMLSRLTGSHSLMKAGGRRILLGCAAAGVVGLSALFILPESALDIGAIGHLRQAFSSEDERTIQGPYLIRAFMESPVLGSGFGGYVDYRRSERRPWTYELTYQKLLFNMGIVGTAYLLSLFSLYFLHVIRVLRRFKDGSAIPFGLLVAFCSLLVGACSDPYFGSFDFLFFAGLLPCLSTFQCGFDRPKSTAGAALCSSNAS